MKLVRLFLVFLAQMLTITAAFAATVQFANPVVYNSGGQETNFVVAADVNGDGFPDMIVANTDGISVLLNNGNGTFAAPVTYPTGGTRAFAVAVADVNGDNLPDLVVTNYCSPSTGCINGGVGVLLNDVNNHGSFLAPVSYAAGGVDTRAVVIGDVTGDGWPDIIVTSNCQALTCVDGSIYLLANKGDGTFKAPVPIAASMGGPLAIGDMNGDGIPDLVADVGVLLGNGDGTFSLIDPVLFGGSPLPGGTISIALQDVNADTILDVIVADQHTVKVQFGNGDGTVQDAIPFKSAGYRPLSVAVADVNRDGFPDIIVANECTSFTNNACAAPGTVGVLAGNGDGTFQPAVKYVSGGKIATSVVVADADQDTRPDIFVANACVSSSNCTNGAVEVLFNTYIAAVTVQVGSSSNPSLIGQTVTLTATLVSGTPVADGSSVNFYNGSTFLGTSTTVAGVASMSKAFGGSGGHIIKATYAGDFYHKPGSGQINQMVNRFPSTTMVVSSPNSSTFGQKVTLTATVSSGASSTPTGGVTFKYGTTVIATVSLSGGTATLSTKNIPVGTWTITAHYAGDSLSAPSSGTNSQTVN